MEVTQRNSPSQIVWRLSSDLAMFGRTGVPKIAVMTALRDLVSEAPTVSSKRIGRELGYGAIDCLVDCAVYRCGEYMLEENRKITPECSVAKRTIWRASLRAVARTASFFCCRHASPRDRSVVGHILSTVAYCAAEAVVSMMSDGQGMDMLLSPLPEGLRPSVARVLGTLARASEDPVGAGQEVVAMLEEQNVEVPELVRSIVGLEPRFGSLQEVRLLDHQEEEAFPEKRLIRRSSSDAERPSTEGSVGDARDVLPGLTD